MRQHRVYIPDLHEGDYLLYGDEAYHLIKVLRVKPGMVLQAFDGKGFEAVAEVLQLAKADICLKLAKPQPSQVEASLEVSLALALLKGDKLADVVRQASELGVRRIQLFSSHYTDVPEISQHKLERLRKIAIEAAKQSGRSFVPEITEPVALAKLELYANTIVAHPYASRVLQDRKIATKVMLITGPEGGLSEDEVAKLEEKGAFAIRFGPRILRAETAPIALLAAVFLPGGL